MTATTIDRNTPRRDGVQRGFPMKAATVIPLGVMVALAAGLLVNAEANPAYPVVGVSEDNFDNSAGADGEVFGSARRGVYRFDNSAAGDQITLADVGSDCYVVDNQTVAKTDDGGDRQKAGVVHDVDDVGVWVEFR